MPRDLGPQQVIVTDGSVLIHQAPKRPQPRRAEPPSAAPQAQAVPESEALAAGHHIASEWNEAPEQDAVSDQDEAPDLDVDPVSERDDEPAQVAGEAYESGSYSGSGSDYSHRTAGLAMEIGAPEAGALERVYGDNRSQSDGDQSAESDSDRARGAETLVLDEFVVPHGARIVTRARRHVPPPPLGWGIEFGTGRLVPIHSFKGRMSYGDHS